MSYFLHAVWMDGSPLYWIDNKINVAVNCQWEPIKIISRRKSYLLVLLFVKLLPAMRFTNASKRNTFNSRLIPEKSFSSIALRVLRTWGCDKRFSKFLLTIVNNSQLLLKSNQILMQSGHYIAYYWWCKFGGIRSMGRLF